MFYWNSHNFLISDPIGPWNLEIKHDLWGSYLQLLFQTIPEEVLMAVETLPKASKNTSLNAILTKLESPVPGMALTWPGQ